MPAGGSAMDEGVEVHFVVRSGDSNSIQVSIEDKGPNNQDYQTDQNTQIREESQPMVQSVPVHSRLLLVATD
jgi:hypothetical protein